MTGEGLTESVTLRVGDEWEAYTQAPPTRPRPADGYSPHTEGTSMTLDDVKKGLTRLMPVLETVAAITPNQYDDAAVAFLKALLAASDEKLSTIVSLTK